MAPYLHGTDVMSIRSTAACPSASHNAHPQELGTLLLLLLLLLLVRAL
jgi:hypothetical protein